MFQHNLILFWRNARKHKNSFLINLIGLSAGLACVLLIYLWVNDELNFDAFHEKGSRIFQVMEHDRQDGTIKTSGHTSDFLAKVLAEEMPEVEHAVVVTPPNFFPSFVLSANATLSITGSGKFADKNFFEIFSYGLIEGTENNVLKARNSIVLSESLAKSLFKTSDGCYGKTIEWQLMGMKRQVSVSGVFKDLPNSSSEKFDFVLPFDEFRSIMLIDGGDMN